MSKEKCPMCGAKSPNWIKIDKQRKGFSVGKAVAGNFLLPGIGLLAGARGKKHETYLCRKCGFTHEY